MIMWNSFNPRRLLLFLLVLTALGTPLAAQDTGKEYVTIYEDFDEGQFGRSEYRSVLRSIRLDNFRRTESFAVELHEEPGKPSSWLTAVVLSAQTVKKLREGKIPSVQLAREENGKAVYRFEKEGILIDFSLESPPEAMLEMIRKHYANDMRWKDPVVNRYQNNYVIRIHTAENVFEPWIEAISYADALISATLIGDRDQWLWGIHDGNALLERDAASKTGGTVTFPEIFEE